MQKTPPLPDWCQERRTVGDATLTRGDSIQMMRSLEDASLDAINTDPPYLLSNGGTTVHGGRRVSVHKGDWDVSRGPENDHAFFLEFLTEAQRVLKPTGSIFISGTHHCIGSIAFAMQKLGFHILNEIVWEKPAPPPNFGCRQLTDDHETILWATPGKGPGGKLLHKFNYDAIKHANRIPYCKKSKCGRVGKAGHTFCPYCGERYVATKPTQVKTIITHPTASDAEKWYIQDAEKWLAPDGHYWYHTKDKDGNPDTASSYPAQKPVGLMRYLFSMVTDPGDVVADPFFGSCAAGVAAAKLGLKFVGNDGNQTAFNIACHRLGGWRDHE
jgi:site-specific DNA-methyltransferase (adenine-specific)